MINTFCYLHDIIGVRTSTYCIYIYIYAHCSRSAHRRGRSTRCPSNDRVPPTCRRRCRSRHVLLLHGVRVRNCSTPWLAADTRHAPTRVLHDRRRRPRLVAWHVPTLHTTLYEYLWYSIIIAFSSSAGSGPSVARGSLYCTRVQEELYCAI